MTANNGPDELNDDFDLPDDIASLLGQEATWEPLDINLEDAIVAAVVAEAAAGPGPLAATEAHSAATHSADVPDDMQDDNLLSDKVSAIEVSNGDAAGNGPSGNVIPMPSRWKSAALGAAAALLLVAGAFGAVRLGGDSPDIELALAGTDLAEGSSAIAEISDSPEGTLIVLTLDGLPPAPPGTYYEAWLRKDAQVGVSAGTFHLRDGEGPIQLWAGVSTDDYPLVTVTLQQEAQTESSGQVVLKALIE